MSTITISNLHPAGSDLFSDSESYMNEMSEGELTGVLGGCTFLCGVAAGVVGNIVYDRLKASSGKCANYALSIPNAY